MSDAQEFVRQLIMVVREERNRQGLTYEDLAAASGLHRTTLGLYDRGERLPTVEAAVSLAAALGIPLSRLIRTAEQYTSGHRPSKQFISRRNVPTTNFRNQDAIRHEIGLSADSLRQAIQNCYLTLDTIDEQLATHDTPSISSLVELANLSSMVGNLLGAGLSESSNGLYKRNRPHSFPDLIPQSAELPDLEIKIALEKNKPKGHLPKAGNYITFRYVLCPDSGSYKKGKENRGNRVFIWEVKVGYVGLNDFDISNTSGDSGKTAVIKTTVFNNMALIYFDPDLLPYATSPYPGYN